VRRWRGNSRITSNPNLPSNNQELISYELLHVPDTALGQCTMSTGAFCGAMKLAVGFEQLMWNKVGVTYADILTSSVLRESQNYFEHYIKLIFNPNDPECPDSFPVPLLGVPDLPAIGLKNGYLEIARSSPIALN
jgi:hypothetical protein